MAADIDGADNGLVNLKKGEYMFSFDGKVNGTDYSVEVPREVYTKHIYIDSGNSSFRRIIGKSKNSMVKESLYLKQENIFIVKKSGGINKIVKQD